MNPGLYPNLTRAEYDAIPAINASRLVHFARTAEHAQWELAHPSEPTETLTFGIALHVAILEPLRFPTAYVVAPKFDMRKTEDKKRKAEFEAERGGATLITQDDYDKLMGMRDSVWSRAPIAEMLSGPGFNEVGVVFEHKETGLLCKGLMDRLATYDGYSWIFDIKGTKDAGKRSFTRDIRNLHYGAKAAFYHFGCNEVSPYPRRFAWIAIEKTPPYAVAVYEADDSALVAGREKFERWLWLYKDAQRTNEWPGYPTEIQVLDARETEWNSL